MAPASPHQSSSQSAANQSKVEGTFSDGFVVVITARSVRDAWKQFETVARNRNTLLLAVKDVPAGKP